MAEGSGHDRVPDVGDPAAIAAETRRLAMLKRGYGRADRGELTPGQKALRDAAVVAAVHVGESKRDVAREFGITPRSVNRILEDYGAMRSPLENVPMETIEGLLRMHEAQIRKFAAVAVDTLDRAPSVAVAALRGQSDAIEKLTSLLSAVGHLPENLELFRTESDLRRVAFAMLEAIKLVEAGDLTVDELRLHFETAWQAPKTYDALPASPELGKGEAA